MAKAYIGISGWQYKDWRGKFYPKGLVQKRELEYASRQISSIEINGTFYSMQKPASFQRWYEATPEDFCFAVKAPQYITHVRRLKDVKEPLANFLASGVLCLKEKLGPILWQFPPSVMLKDDRFETFMKMLPHESKGAARLAKKHSEFMKDRSYTKVDRDFRIRHAFEFRHPSFDDPKFIDKMRKHNVAFVLAHSGADTSPYVDEKTADFMYIRMHGQEAKYKKGYTKDVIDWLAKKVKQGLKEKTDAFIYFDNDAKAHAPHDALKLIDKIKIR